MSDLIARIQAWLDSDAHGNDSYEAAISLLSEAADALTTDRQERDRLRVVLRRIADCEDYGCTCCEPCLNALAASLSPQDGQQE
jgi:hypothetical protein